MIDWSRLPSLSVVIPAHNEEETLPHCVAHVREVMQGLGARYEIIIVDDASNDRTGVLADAMASADAAVRVIHHARNRTLGGALRSGFYAARNALILYVDADLPFDLVHLERALRAMRLTQADLIAGYRLDRTGEGIRRTLYSFLWNWLVGVLFKLPHRDVNFSFKLFDRDLLERLHLVSEGSFIDAELVVRARNLGCNIQQIGVDYFPRSRGVSSLSSWRIIRAMVVEMVRLYPELARDRRARSRAAAQARRRPLRVKRRGVPRGLPESPPESAIKPTFVVVNADDFGLSDGINRGILRAHREGIVTSASLVAGGEAFTQAVDMAGRNPGLDIGLHLTLVGGETPVLDVKSVASLVGRDGRFRSSYRGFLLRYLRGQVLLREVEDEWRAQIERALAAGIQPSHLDSHQHLHALPALAEIIAKLARESGITWVRRSREDARLGGLSLARRAAMAGLERLERFGTRRLAQRFAGRPTNGVRHPDRTLGIAYAGRLDTTLLRRLLAAAGSGVNELVCHPGAGDREIAVRYRWGYAWERELAALTDPALPYIIRGLGIRLTTFRELALAEPGRGA